MTFSVYILYSSKLDNYYVGTTDNVERRLGEHNTKEHEGSFSTKGIPWELKFVIDNLSSSQAYAIEKHIKKMKSAVYIENLMRYSEMAEKLKIKFQ